jgi:hypothetical protein
MDPFRIDRDLLYFQLMDVLSDENLIILTNTKDYLINQEIVRHATASFHFLSLDNMGVIADKLKSLVAYDNLAVKEIQRSISYAKQSYYWNKYKFLVALISAVLVCICIYLSKR